MILQTTLASAAAAALVAFWLASRILLVRRSSGISHGHGDSALLARRMRAQLNYTEYTPFVLILCAAIELAGKGGLWLSVVMGLYMLVRIAHAIGMDSESVPLPRRIGTLGTYLVMVGLALYAALIAAGVL